MLSLPPLCCAEELLLLTMRWRHSPTACLDGQVFQNSMAAANTQQHTGEVSLRVMQGTKSSGVTAYQLPVGTSVAPGVFAPGATVDQQRDLLLVMSIQSLLCLTYCYFHFILQEEIPCPSSCTPHLAKSQSLQCLLSPHQSVSAAGFQLNHISDLPRSARQEMPTAERNSSPGQGVSQQAPLLSK